MHRVSPFKKKAAGGASVPAVPTKKVDSATRERAMNAVKSVFGISPLTRQRTKEGVWKERLARTKSSWWDAAAIGIVDGRCNVDRALNRSSAFADHSLITLAKGRMHGQADVKAVNAWRDEALDSFMGATPKPTKPLPRVLSEPQFSPGHFHRKYCTRGTLPPLPAAEHMQRKLRLAELATASQERELRAREMRTMVFHTAALAPTRCS